MNAEKPTPREASRVESDRLRMFTELCIRSWRRQLIEMAAAAESQREKAS